MSPETSTLAAPSSIHTDTYVFKPATTRDELDQIHRLNYDTFVREVHQHTDTGTGRLVDKFHDKNRYFVALRDRRVVGMISVHDQPPFSIAARLDDPETLARLGDRLLEVRLLAISQTERFRTVFAGLCWMTLIYARDYGYSHMLISGVQERIGLYERLGFRSLGPPKQCGDAWFAPMAMAIAELPDQIERYVHLWRARVEPGPTPTRERPLSLLPGPVQLSPAVRAAFARPPISHRSPEFIELYERTRGRLSAMVGGLRTALLCGSGTLANDVVAATLAADHALRQGLVLVNGEFGRRLAEQARHVGLHPHVLSWDWGQPWDLGQVEEFLTLHPDVDWVWGAHLETSTGMLNDLAGLAACAARRDVRVCLDCISSLGAVPLDLSRIHLATAASGKSLGSYAGLSLVFAAPDALAGVDYSRWPTYLDLRAALDEPGPRFTVASPLVTALATALEEYATPAACAACYERYAALGRFVRGELRGLGWSPLVDEPWAAPVITTFSPPGTGPSHEFIERCRSWGYDVHGHSEYLASRRWVQLATMGNVRTDDCAPLFERLRTFQRAVAGQ